MEGEERGERRRSIHLKLVLSFSLPLNKDYNKRKITIFRFWIIGEKRDHSFHFCCHRLAWAAREGSYYLPLTIRTPVNLCKSKLKSLC